MNLLPMMIVKKLYFWGLKYMAVFIESGLKFTFDDDSWSHVIKFDEKNSSIAFFVLVKYKKRQP